MLEYRSDPDEHGQRWVVCPVCGFERLTHWPVEKVRHRCTGSQAPPPRPGPGWHMAQMLTQLGIRPREGDSCKCLKQQAKMDRLGASGCRQKFADLLAHLQAQYDDASLATKLQAAALALTGGLPLSLAGLLEEAIRRAEADA